MEQTIENLVFKGGGVLGIAYAGALTVLEQNNKLESVQRVAGTSAGAITATLVSLRYSAAEITTIVNETNFKSFQDGEIILNALHTLRDYGFYNGDAFLNWMKKYIQQAGLAPNATFQDFAAKGCRDLHVFATDLNEKGLKEFSVHTTPTVVVAEAVRASMSIPMFFKAWQFPGANPDNHIYVDGGVLYNFPISVFDSNGVANPGTLGFFLTNLSKPAQVDNLGLGEFPHYIKNLFDTLLSVQNIDFSQNAVEQHRTVQIDTLNISATDFNINDDQKKALFDSGVQYTTQHLKDMGVISDE
jgi:NTE family protein